jgi:hypothetical protein
MIDMQDPRDHRRVAAMTTDQASHRPTPVPADLRAAIARFEAGG